MDELFRRVSEQVSRMVGSIWAALLAMILVLGSGWKYHFSELWKTDTSLVAGVFALLLLIFLQKSQNHSDKATHLKLDELIRALEGARSEVLDAENYPNSQLEELKKEISEEKENSSDY